MNLVPSQHGNFPERFQAFYPSDVIQSWYVVSIEWEENSKVKVSMAIQESDLARWNLHMIPEHETSRDAPYHLAAHSQWSTWEWAYIVTTHRFLYAQGICLPAYQFIPLGLQRGYFIEVHCHAHIPDDLINPWWYLINHVLLLPPWYGACFLCTCVHVYTRASRAT